MGEHITIGHLSTVYHTSFILEGTDWLRKAGIDAEWKLFASGPDIVKAFENKEIDLGYIGLPPVIIGVARGIPFKCIAGGHVEGTVMLAQKEFKGLDEAGDIKQVLGQFEGKAIGTPPKGSIHDVIARDLVESLGLGIEGKNTRGRLRAGPLWTGDTPARGYPASRRCKALLRRKDRHTAPPAVAEQPELRYRRPQRIHGI